MKTTTIILCLLVSSLQLLAQSGGNFNSLEFVENKGQWDKQVQFQADFGSGAFFLRKNGIAVLQRNTQDMESLGHVKYNPADTLHSRPIRPDGSGSGSTDDNTQHILHSHMYFMDFVGANENAEIVGEKPQDTYYNYFIGNDKSKWAGGVKVYQSVLYKNIYPNIDVRYFTNDGLAKYEFIVNPGGDPSKIVMQFRGADKLSINKNNELVIKTSVGDVTELAPYTYQVQNGTRVKIDCKYVINGNNVTFKLKSFQSTETLIIDPALIFASFTGSRADNWGYTATYGGDGSFYAGGIVFANGFVTTAGAFQSSYSGRGQEMFNMGIMRFNPSGTQRMFGTYIGGTGKEQPHSMFADGNGNLVIAGRTTSTDYPSTIRQVNGGGNGDWNIVLTKISFDGKQLLGSLVIGGSGDDGRNIGDSHSSITRNQSLINFYGDDARSEVILDKSGNAYLASCTQSTNFPVTSNAVQPNPGGKQDGVLIKVNAAFTQLLYSSYIGGNGDDAAFVLALDQKSQDVYVAGGTNSTNLPVTAGVVQSTYSGGESDGFVAAFSNDGATMKKMTYLGTSKTDVVYGIQFDRDNFPYVMGITTGDWQPINAAWSQSGCQFVGKLKEDLSDWVFRTKFGTSLSAPNMSPVAFLVDRCENMYISGWGKAYGSFNMQGVRGMSVTPDAIKSDAPDNADFYFIVIKRNAASQLYGTFFGQNSGGPEHVDGGTSRFDQNGVIYQAMCANCLSSATAPRPQFPITAGAVCCSNKWSGANGTGSGAECNLAAVKIVFNYAGVGSGVRAFIEGRAKYKGCVPADFEFKDTVLNAASYIWDFGDGTPQQSTKNFDVSHTYPNVGSYKVMLVAIDSNSCNIRDTAYTTITVGNDKVNFAFDFQKLQPCEALDYQFTNKSTVISGKPFTNTSFIWDFGDGTRIPSGTAPQSHSYAAPGTYNVTLILADTGYCNSPDSLTESLRVSPLVRAQFETPAEGCAPYTAAFHNTSLGGDTFDWDFGDGSAISHDINPSHAYPPGPNVYTVKLTAYDENTCNKVHDTTFTITVHTSPTAAYTFAPITPAENRPTTFTNNSSTDAIQFAWRFGDGDSLITSSRNDIDHQYNISGTFEACLDAVNAFGCHDTACNNIQAIVVPKLDVPNAFTPLGPTSASTIYVHGFGINTMKWVIYNRWGQKVFETNDRRRGWDGRFNGVVQPMDVYGYTLEVEFVDGEKLSRKGDITLIR